MFWIAFLVSSAIVGWWHWRLAKIHPNSPTLPMRLARHRFPFLLFLVVCLILYGGLGAVFGIPKLFRDDHEIYQYGLFTLQKLPALTPLFNSPLVLSLAAATIMLAIIWTFIRLTEIAGTEPQAVPDERSHRRFFNTHGMPFVLFLVVAVAFPQDHGLAHGWQEILLALLGGGAGYLLAMALISSGHRLAPRLNRWRWVRRLVGWVACHTRYGKPATRDLTAADCDVHGAFLMFTLVQLLLLGFVTVSRIIIPSVAILMLIGWVTLFYFIFMWLRPVPRWAALMLLIVAILFGNSRLYKYSFPGFETADGESAYAADRRIKLEVAALESTADELVDPLAALNAWRANAVRGAHQERPKLVVITTEGGAYRSAFWTAVVLDELETLSREDGALRGLTSGIRLITGASGGMVGAAYYVALRSNDTDVKPPSVVATLREDIRLSRSEGIHPTRFPISGDTLSPVVQQMVQRDIFSTFWPGPVSMDRGRVLESHWRTLNVSFAALAAGERAGWRPSILLTPMLVETGQQLAITNMNMARLDGAVYDEVEEFFAIFGAWHETFTLATAVRMNASFPYVSPAVSLPTEPARRVLDAGHFDNYGVYSATAWLGQQEIASWVDNNTSGVIVVQIRAFPPRDLKDSWYGRAFQWVTSPLQANVAARTSTNLFRNDEALRRLQQVLPNVPVDTLVFANNADPAAVAMSWYITEGEVAETRKQFESARNRAALTCLKELWTNHRNPRAAQCNARNQVGTRDARPY